MEAEFDNELTSITRDMFVFSTFCGLSYIDVKNLTYDNIVKQEDGSYWIMTHRQKTGNASNVRFIRQNTHLIRKRTKQYATTRASNDQTAGLTFVNSQTHTNLSTNFMLIPEVRLFFCFVISFLFSMTFFSAASVRSAVFV